MSIYERVLNIDEETFDRLMSKGFLRSTAKRDLQIYEFYLSEYINVGSMQAIMNASIKFNLSDKNIESIIYKTKKCINYI